MVHRRRPISLLTSLTVLLLTACGHMESEAQQRDADSLGTRAREIRSIRTDVSPALVESSGAAMSTTQPGVLFTINDSGNDPLLFAVDTTGEGRGIWHVEGARNVDWESVAVGPCNPPTVRQRGASCVYIGDVGDNEERRRSVAIYRLDEPAARGGGKPVTIAAQRLTFRYEDGAHDVEAMFVTPGADVILITKRPRRDEAGRLRPALVFRVPSSAWQRAGGTGNDAAVVASLVDSFPIVPGSAKERTITDAALSPDARYLAVRTYAQLFVFAVDPASGMRRADVPPATCNIARVQKSSGEGVTWVGTARTLLLTREGKKAPMVIVECPLPALPASP